MNPISPQMSTGCVGELLVQIRLLQHGVQAAPPILDTGNDLIAVNGKEFRAISVRTTTGGTYNKPRHRDYHVLAVVHLRGEGRDLDLNNSQVYLIPSADVASAPTNCEKLAAYSFSRQHVQVIFGQLAT